METIEICTYVGGDDYRLFSGIVNQGIDAHLEAFTQSEFHQDGHRFYFNFSGDEASILLRRLSEIADKESLAYAWLNDILSVYFGVELLHTKP